MKDLLRDNLNELNTELENINYIYKYAELCEKNWILQHKKAGYIGLKDCCQQIDIIMMNYNSFSMRSKVLLYNFNEIVDRIEDTLSKRGRVSKEQKQTYEELLLLSIELLNSYKNLKIELKSFNKRYSEVEQKIGEILNLYSIDDMLLNERLESESEDTKFNEFYEDEDFDSDIEDEFVSFTDEVKDEEDDFDLSDNYDEPEEINQNAPNSYHLQENPLSYLSSHESHAFDSEIKRRFEFLSEECEKVLFVLITDDPGFDYCIRFKIPVSILQNGSLIYEGVPELILPNAVIVDNKSFNRHEYQFVVKGDDAERLFKLIAD